MKKCLKECRNGVLWTQKNRSFCVGASGAARVDGWDTLNLEVAVTSLEEGLLPQPSALTLANIIRKCANDKNKTDYTLRLHAYMLQGGLEAYASIGNHLVTLLADVGSMRHAHELLDKLKVKSEHSWNALINGYLKCGEFRHAFNLYQKMQEDRIDPSGHTYVALLKACAKLKDGERGSQMHAQIAKKGLLRSNRFVGTALVDMYAKCGMLMQAREVFDMLSTHDIVLWNALIAGYAQQDCGEDALECLELLQHQGFSPNAVTLACSLKACGSIGAIDKGRELHVEIARIGLQKTNQFVGNALVDMYAKCGLLVKAQEVFDMLPIQNIVSWNVMISAYVQHKRGKDALDCYDQMQLKGVFPDEVTIACILKACGSIGALDKGIQIHSDIAKSGLLKNLLVGNALVDFYTKCNMLGKAREVFDELSARDVVSWTTLIAGYAQHEHGDEALDCFEQMQLSGVTPDANAYISCLKACGSIGAISEGREIHADIERKGLLKASPAVGNALVEMYATCGLFPKAHEVLDVLSVRNVVVWTALIAGYVQHERGEEALDCFEQMQLEGVSPDVVTLAYGLKACGSIGAVKKGRELHCYIESKGFLQSSVVGTALLDMYAKCGWLEKAEEVFHKLPKCDAVAWNALIAGYVQHECSEEALSLYEQMEIQCISPNDVTYVCILRACCSIRAFEKGQEIHAEISRKGIWIMHQHIGNALIDLYAKCGSLVLAQEVFETLPSRDTISWNAVISGYVQHDCGEKALECFEKMRRMGVPQDAATLTCGLKACGSIGNVEKGQEIHVDIERKRLLENVVVGTCVVDMYAKCGLLAKAHEVFSKLSVHDVIAWTTLISGYAQHEQSQEALNCLEQMRHDGVSPNANTYACSLKACGNSGNIEKGSELHVEVEQIGLLKSSQIVGNAVIDMYAKCGMLPKSQEVFDKLPVRDLFSWNILITGYAQRGETENVFHMFEKMGEEGLKPDAVTFTSLLNACSHAGLIERGQTYFESMRQNYGVIPTLEHDTCMVDLFGRAGQLERALEVMKKSLFHPHIEMWLTVLSACRNWENVDLGRQAFQQAVRLDQKEVAAYVCMYNIYADAGMEEDAREVEEMSEIQAGKKLCCL